jgi:DNA-binding MurR/RpiR family transcriptional regulator
MEGGELAEAFANVEQLLRARFDGMTRAERQIVTVLLEDFPMLGLSSVSEVAQRADVSAPTVVRMVQKLGFEGYGEFQEALRAELSAKISDPIRKRERWAREAPDSHVLNRFAATVTDNLRQTLGLIDTAQFDEVATRLADLERGVFILGGRITGSLADYLFKHLQVIRPRVRLLGDSPAVWPHDLLNAERGDLVVIFDIRRYENVLLKFAELAQAQGLDIALLTDRWGSPVSRHARYRFNCHTEAPSTWDSNVALLAIAEALVAQVQELTWATSKPRMEALEEMFDRTGLFRKFT